MLIPAKPPSYLTIKGDTLIQYLHDKKIKFYDLKPMETKTKAFIEKHKDSFKISTIFSINQIFVKFDNLITNQSYIYAYIAPNAMSTSFPTETAFAIANLSIYVNYANHVAPRGAILSFLKDFLNFLYQDLVDIIPPYPTETVKPVVPAAAIEITGTPVAYKEFVMSTDEVSF